MNNLKLSILCAVHSACRYMVGEDPDGPLVQMDIREFIMAIGARSASPGGGTVAALTSTLVS